MQLDFLLTRPQRGAGVEAAVARAAGGESIVACTGKASASEEGAVRFEKPCMRLHRPEVFLDQVLSDHAGLLGTMTVRL